MKVSEAEITSMELRAVSKNWNLSRQFSFTLKQHMIHRWSKKPELHILALYGSSPLISSPSLAWAYLSPCESPHQLSSVSRWHVCFCLAVLNKDTRLRPQLVTFGFYTAAKPAEHNRKTGSMTPKALRLDPQLSAFVLLSNKHASEIRRKTQSLQQAVHIVLKNPTH